MKTRFSHNEGRNKGRNESSRLDLSGSRALAELNAAALQNNYRAIHALLPKQAVLPMIKANAYGHGGDWVAQQLQSLPALYGFGVASLEEGSTIREALGPRGRKIRIIVFSGSIPWTEDKGQYCEDYGLTPVIASDADWNSFLKGGWPARLPYEIKFNTGMNRLGLSFSMAPAIAHALHGKPSEWHPAGVFSHLAQADDPDAKLSRLQLDRFQALRSEFNSACPGTQFHLANSAGIWNHKYWQLDGLTDVIRPGLSLYGIPPWKDAPARGILPVLTLKAPVLTVHQLKAGESLGYGATYTANESVRAAILGIGYADGLHRTLSNRGHVWIGGRPDRVLGRVSMDLSAVQCSAQVRVGDWAEFLGPHVDPWAQAEAAQTIPYELLTSISSRVQRVYEH